MNYTKTAHAITHNMKEYKTITFKMNIKTLEKFNKLFIIICATELGAAKSVFLLGRCAVCCLTPSSFAAAIKTSSGAVSTFVHHLILTIFINKQARISCPFASIISRSF